MVSEQLTPHYRESDAGRTDLINAQLEIPSAVEVDFRNLSGSSKHPGPSDYGVEINADSVTVSVESETLPRIEVGKPESIDERRIGELGQAGLLLQNRWKRGLDLPDQARYQLLRFVADVSRTVAFLDAVRHLRNDPDAAELDTKWALCVYKKHVDAFKGTSLDDLSYPPVQPGFELYDPEDIKAFYNLSARTGGHNEETRTSYKQSAL